MFQSTHCNDEELVSVRLSARLALRVLDGGVHARVRVEEEDVDELVRIILVALVADVLASVGHLVDRLGKALELLLTLRLVTHCRQLSGNIYKALDCEQMNSRGFLCPSRCSENCQLHVTKNSLRTCADLPQHPGFTSHQ